MVVTCVMARVDPGTASLVRFFRVGKPRELHKKEGRFFVNTKNMEKHRTCRYFWVRTSRSWRLGVLFFKKINQWNFMEFGEDTVDGRNPAHQLRLVIHPIICRVFLHLRWFAGFLPSAVSSMHTFEPSKSAFLMEFLIWVPAWNRWWFQQRASFCYMSGRVVQSGACWPPDIT